MDKAKGQIAEGSNAENAAANALYNRKILRRLLAAINAIDRAYYKDARSSGVKANFLDLLYILDDGEAHTQKSICEQWLIPKTTLNTIIKECEAHGYIQLKQVGGKRRELQVCLTAAGEEKAKEILSPLYEAEEQALQEAFSISGTEFVSGLECYGSSLNRRISELVKKGADNEK